MVEQRIVAPKVEGSSPSFYPTNMLYFLRFYSNLAISSSTVTRLPSYAFFQKTYFLFSYYTLNDLIWQEGLLVDFLQKKIADNWIKKFLIYSAYLFSERLLFDKTLRFYLDLIIWPLHSLFIFEFNNAGSILFVNLFIFFVSFYFWSLFYFFLIMF